MKKHQIKIHFRFNRIIIYILWLVILAILFVRFRQWFLMVALIIAVLAGAADLWLAYRMAAGTEVRLEPATEKETQSAVIHIISHVTMPSSAVKIKLSYVNESDGGIDTIELTYPLYSNEDLKEKLPVNSSSPGESVVRLEQVTLDDVLNMVVVKCIL